MNLFIFSEVFRNQNNIIFNTVYKTQLLNEINENKHRENYSIENYRDYHVKNNAYITKQICTIIQEFNDQYKEKGVNMNKNKFNFKGKL